MLNKFSSRLGEKPTIVSTGFFNRGNYCALGAIIGLLINERARKRVVQNAKRTDRCIQEIARARVYLRAETDKRGGAARAGARNFRGRPRLNEIIHSR